MNIDQVTALELSGASEQAWERALEVDAATATGWVVHAHGKPGQILLADDREIWLVEDDSVLRLPAADLTVRRGPVPAVRVLEHDGQQVNVGFQARADAEAFDGVAAACGAHVPDAAAPPAANPVSAAQGGAVTSATGGGGASHGPQPGGARFVGDATPFAGIPLSRLFNGGCYVVTGIFLLVAVAAGALTGGDRWWGLLAAAAMAGYGGKILMTRTSYWVSTVTYLFPVLAVGWALASLH